MRLGYLVLGPMRKHSLGEPAPAPTKRRLEAHDQAEIVGWLRERGELVVRCEQGARRKWGAARDKRLGVVAGVPDLIWVRGAGRLVWIECKRIGGRLSPEQIAIHEVLRRMGHVVIVGYGSQDLIAQCQRILDHDANRAANTFG